VKAKSRAGKTITKGKHESFVEYEMSRGHNNTHLNPTTKVVGIYIQHHYTLRKLKPKHESKSLDQINKMEER
jgi:hypothetical protein